MPENDRLRQDTPALEPFGVGLLGTGFMAHAHTRALAYLRSLEPEPAAIPSLAMVCGRTAESAKAFQQQYGFTHAVTDWRELVTAPTVAALDNVGPNSLHAEPIIAAALAGKHVLSEKPLARNRREAKAMLVAVRGSHVVNMCAFNYRFFPAIRLAHAMISDGAIGTIHAFRSRFFVSPKPNTHPSRPDWRLSPELAGSGVVANLLPHDIDLARYLVGEITAVTAITRGPTSRFAEHTELETAVAATIEFANGTIGTMEAASSPDRPLESTIEIDGATGSLSFSVKDLNHLKHSTSTGSHYIDATQAKTEFSSLWWPPGHALGWADSFVHELRHFLGACAGAWPVEPHGASFEDGYRCAEICDAILDAAQSGRRTPIAHFI